MKIRDKSTLIKAVREFTDREEPRSAFWAKYNTVKNEKAENNPNVHVISYYGIGGIGKSSLLKELQAELTRNVTKPQFIEFDFNVAQESLTVLSSLKNKLHDTYEFDFPLFDLGCYSYSKKIGAKIEDLEVKQITEKNAVLKFVFSLFDNVPVVNVATKVLSVADQCVAQIRTYIKTHSRELAQIDNLDASALYKHLPALFAADLTLNLENKNTEPFVFFLDTYEALVNEISQNGDPLLNDRWLRDENGLIQNIPHVLWVIAGREKLKWEDFDSDWQDALEQHILGNLSPNDSEQFLKKAGVDDVILRKQLFELTNGTPVYLDLCVDQFYRAKDKGQAPSIEHFGKNTYELIERFVRYMNDAQKDLIYTLVCLNTWNDTLADEISSAILPNFSITTYNKIKDYSIINKISADTYHIHQTVGEILLSNCDKIIKNKVADYLFTKYCNIDIKDYNSFELFKNDLTHLTQSLLLKFQVKDCSLDSEEKQANRNELTDLYRNYVRRKIYTLIKYSHYTYAKPIIDMLLELAKENQNDLFYAQMLGDIAYYYSEIGYFYTAEKYASESIKIYKNFTDIININTLKVCDTLWLIYLKTDEKQKALEIAKCNFIETFKQYGKEKVEAYRALSNLAITYEHLYLFRKAKLLRELIYNKRKSILGEFDPETARALYNLALSLKSEGDEFKKHGNSVQAIALYKESLDKMEYALSIQRKFLKNRHSDMNNTLDAIAVVYMLIGDFENAVNYSNQILHIRIEMHSKTHPSVLKTLNNRAQIFEQSKEFKKALAIREYIYETYWTIYGPSAPQTLNAEKSLNKLKEIFTQAALPN